MPEPAVGADRPPTARQGASDPSGSAPTAADPTRRRWYLAVVVGWLLQVAWRLWFARDVYQPIAYPDEDDYLLVARLLAGGPGSELQNWSPLRQVGYPAVLSPIYLFTQDHLAVFRGAQLVNALLSALVMPLSYRICRRWLQLDRRWAFGVAFTVATLPMTVYFSRFALTENLLTVLFLGWLVAAHGWLATGPGSRRSVAAFAAGAICGYAAVTHVRGLVMAAAHLLLCLVVVVSGRFMPRRAAAGGLAATLAGVVPIFVTGTLINKWIGRTLFPNGMFPFALPIERLSSMSGWAHVISDGLGQLWYVAVGTWGLAALGLVIAAAALRRRDTPVPVRLVLGVALLVTAGIMFATAAALPADTRLNYHFYGRYASVTTPLWATLALARVRSIAPRRIGPVLGWAAGLVAASGLVVLAYAGRQFATNYWVTFDAPEIAFLAGAWGEHFQPWQFIAVSAIAVGAAVMVSAALAGTAGRSSRPDGLRVVGCVVALVLVNAVAMTVITERGTKQWLREQYQSVPSMVGDVKLVPGRDVVAASSSLNQYSQLGLRLQREVYWTKISFFDPAAGPPAESNVVITTREKAGYWDGQPSGYHQVHSHAEPSGVTLIVWRR